MGPSWRKRTTSYQSTNFHTNRQPDQPPLKETSQPFSAKPMFSWEKPKAQAGPSTPIELRNDAFTWNRMNQRNPKAGFAFPHAQENLNNLFPPAPVMRSDGAEISYPKSFGKKVEESNPLLKKINQAIGSNQREERFKRKSLGFQFGLFPPKEHCINEVDFSLNSPWENPPLTTRKRQPILASPPYRWQKAREASFRLSPDRNYFEKQGTNRAFAKLTEAEFRKDPPADPFKAPLHCHSRVIDKHKDMKSFAAGSKKRKKFGSPQPSIQEDSFCTSFSSVNGTKLFRYKSGSAAGKRLRILREFRKAKSIIAKQKSLIKSLQEPPDLDHIRHAFQKVVETPRSNNILFQSRVNNMTRLLNSIPPAQSNKPNPVVLPKQTAQLVEAKEKYREICQLSKSKDAYIASLESHNQALLRKISNMESSQKCLESTASTLKELELKLDVFIDEHNIPPPLLLDSFLEGPGCWPAPHKPPSFDSSQDNPALGIKDRISRIIRHPFYALTSPGPIPGDYLSEPKLHSPTSKDKGSPNVLMHLSQLLRKTRFDQ